MIIETKFNYGDDAWYMKDNKPVHITVTELLIKFTYLGYTGKWLPGVEPSKAGHVAYPQLEYYKAAYTDKEWVEAELLFKTKEELIASL